MSTYKEAINQAMLEFAKDEKARFIGYNVKYGLAGGSLAGVPEDRLIETPVAENLMVGMAIGLSLLGYKPMVYFERCDFVTNAMDAIVNHLDKIETLSDGQFKPAVILRIVVGNKKKPLFTGATHTQNFADALNFMVRFPVFSARTPDDVIGAYRNAATRNQSAAILEFKDLY